MTIAVIDDYKPDRLAVADYARRYLEKSGGPEASFRLYSGGREFIDELSRQSFDLVLLDCCMDDMDGLQTAKELRQRDEAAALIFITSCPDYAIDGYLVAASGYLVKPFDDEQFSRVFDSVFHRLPHKRGTILIPYGDGRRVFVDSVISCDVEGHYVVIHCTDSIVFRIRMTFSAMAGLLAPYPQFLSCYRGCLINMDHIHKAEDMNFLMDNGERVPFRRKEHGKLLRLYSDYLFKKARDSHR